MHAKSPLWGALWRPGLPLKDSPGFPAREVRRQGLHWPLRRCGWSLPDLVVGLVLAFAGRTDPSCPHPQAPVLDSPAVCDKGCARTRPALLVKGSDFACALSPGDDVAADTLKAIQKPDSTGAGGRPLYGL